MGRLGVVGGHSILGSAYGTDAVRVDTDIDGARVAMFDAGTHVVVQRHGVDSYTPAHLVPHVANMRALVDAGCDRVLALSSVGGLRGELGVGAFVAPDDFIALDTVISAYDDERAHIVPTFDGEWRTVVIGAVHEHASVPLHNGGVYWQVSGPRFETRAEIRLISRFADIVGMTAASESIVAQQLGLSYAVICVVDNLANGVAEQPLTLQEFEAGKRATRAAVLDVLAAVVPRLAR